jgi:hypothetical protein
MRLASMTASITPSSACEVDESGREMDGCVGQKGEISRLL